MSQQTIWKYPLFMSKLRSDQTVIKMPEGAKILTLQIDQKDKLPHIWVKVNMSRPENSKTVQRTFIHIGTGHIHDHTDLEYIGTWQLQGYVFHTFEVI